MSGLTKAEVAEIARFEADVDGWERAAHLHSVATEEARRQAGDAMCRRVNADLPCESVRPWRWSARLGGVVRDQGDHLHFHLYRPPFSGWETWFAYVFNVKRLQWDVILKGDAAGGPSGAMLSLLDVGADQGSAKRVRDAKAAVEQFLADAGDRRVGKVGS